jgi:two-component system NtrC family sensor kinase
MKHRSLRTRLIITFSGVIVIGFFLSSLSGTHMIGDTIVKQAQDKVRLDLNSAREVLRNEISNVRHIIRLTSSRFFLRDALLSGNKEKLLIELHKIREEESLDVLNLTTATGHVVVRSRNPVAGGDRLNRKCINLALANRTIVESIEIFTAAELLTEGEDLAQQARIPIVFPPGQLPPENAVETSGMMISAAAPVYDYNKNPLGVLYGAKLINRNYEIVDKVKEIVYKSKKYKGKDIGTVTIFQDNLRISTNVENIDGSRAIGTRVSQEVYNQVVVKGIPWINRAYVVKDWYITAYEPIKNLAGAVIGMLYVGILEAPYKELRHQVLYNFLTIALLSVALLIITAYFTAIRTTKPLKELIIATNEVARGNLSHRVHIKSYDEIGQLTDSFNRMTGDIENLTRNYQTLNRTLEDKVTEKTKELRDTRDQLIQSEKLSSLGRMAAGVAHEINNPLTSILINAHLLAEETVKEKHLKENIDLIIDETGRCSTIVKDLLHFSRQTEPVRSPGNINGLIEKVILLLKNQFLLQNINVVKNLDPGLPKIIIDKSKIEQVFTNVMMNSLDALPEKGELVIESRRATNPERVEVLFRDNGCGIPEKEIGKIFDPFFSTKGTKGTGLGLSVSYGIIRQHGGKIDVRSAVGEGTTIIISFLIKKAKEDVK